MMRAALIAGFLVWAAFCFLRSIGKAIDEYERLRAVLEDDLP